MIGGRRRRTPEPASRPATLRFRRIDAPPRAWHPLDAFLYNLMTTLVAVLIGFPLIAGPLFYYPVVSLQWAIGIAGALCLAEAVVYALLIASFPDNGGDYLFQSKLLGGSVASVFAFLGVVVGGALRMGIAGWFASRVAVGPFFFVLGRGADLQWMETMGRWIMSPWGAPVLTVVVVLWSALFTARGLALYARVQRILVLAGLVAVTVLVVYFSLTRVTLHQLAGRQFIVQALNLGYDRFGRPSLGEAVVQLLPAVSFGLIYPGWVAFQAGEVRRAGEPRIQLLTVVGGKALTVVFALLILPMPLRHVGGEVFGAGVFMALRDPVSFWAMMPRLVELNAPGWFSVATFAILALAVNAWFWVWMPNHTLAASRVLVAMSWDWRMPRWLRDLDHRGSPVKAIVTFSAVALILTALYDLTELVVTGTRPVAGVWALALHATILNLAAFTVTCIAAALFPFRRRELYRESAAGPYAIGRLPLVTLMGGVFSVFAVYLLYRYLVLSDASFRVSIVNTLTIAIVQYAAAIALYLLLRLYRLRRMTAQVEMRYRDA